MAVQLPAASASSSELARAAARPRCRPRAPAPPAGHPGRPRPAARLPTSSPRRGPRRPGPAAGPGAAALRPALARTPWAGGAVRRSCRACSGCASGTRRPPASARPASSCAFSATQWPSAAPRSITRCGSTLAAGRSSSVPRSSVLGTRIRRPGRAGVTAPRSGSMPARRSSAQVRISGSPTSAVGSSDSIRLEQRDAQRLALGAAGTVVGLFGVQVMLDLGVRQRAEAHDHRRHQSPGPGRCRRAPPPRRCGRPPRGRASPAVAPPRAHGAGLADGLAVQVGHLVGADHHRAGCRARLPAPSPAPAAPPARPALRRAAASRRPGRIGLESQPQAGQQLAPVGRGGAQDQAGHAHGVDCRRAAGIGRRGICPDPAAVHCPMKRQHDPLRLDVAAFAPPKARLVGQLAAARCRGWPNRRRRRRTLPCATVAWSARASACRCPAANPRLWLELQCADGLG